jgi:hypothetical protein
LCDFYKVKKSLFRGGSACGGADKKTP